ncbi:MAG TPA: hypothetical protein DCY88_04190 [Cyanobacteria bacterium UBA11372]|nr:hypothetical protein [Cyanobacteria bacterium UBA11372]
MVAVVRVDIETPHDVGARHPGSLGLNRKVNDAVPLREIIWYGRALILLDGLDEVRDADSRRLLRKISEFTQQFPQNQFVITCRIAAREYTFEKFTDVEIADFNDEQIADFSGKWFHNKNDPIKADRFVQKLKEDAPIRELATNPLLLTLWCLVFKDSGSFPTNRAELYQTGGFINIIRYQSKETCKTRPYSTINRRSPYALGRGYHVAKTAGARILEATVKIE